MSQTALNLAAICVFLMTFSILLGPFLSIPPELPAIATISLLGLATVDSFKFQGQGGSLVVDWFAQRSPAHRARIAHHEAGHFLVADRLGITVTDYSLSAWEARRKGKPGLGGVSFAEPSNQLSAQELDRYCTVWMAGIAAEQIVYETAEGGSDDRTKLRGVLATLSLDPQQKERLAIFQAKNLLQTNWPAYQALVAAMQERKPMADCQQILSDERKLNISLTEVTRSDGKSGSPPKSPNSGGL
jgi:hypothetical protein